MIKRGKESKSKKKDKYQIEKGENVRKNKDNIEEKDIYTMEEKER